MRESGRLYSDNVEQSDPASKLLYVLDKRSYKTAFNLVENIKANYDVVDLRRAQFELVYGRIKPANIAKQPEAGHLGHEVSFAASII